MELDGTEIPGLPGLARFSSVAIANAMAQGWMALSLTGTPYLTAARLGSLAAQLKSNIAEVAITAGIQHKRNLGINPGAPPMTVAIIVLRTAYMIEDNQERDALRAWAVARLASDPAAASAALLDFWGAMLRAKSQRIEHMDEIARGAPDILRPVLVALLSGRPHMPMEALATTLHHGIALLDRETLTSIARKALNRKTLGSEQRARWFATWLRLNPVAAGPTFTTELPEEAGRLTLTLPHLEAGPTAFDGLPEADAVVRDTLLIREVGRHHKPDDRFGGNIGPRQMLSGIVSAAISRLAALPSATAGETLQTLGNDPMLWRWGPHLQHAIAEQIRVRRDFAFRNPKPAVVCAALAGGPPVNASDLLAIALDELERLARETQIGATSPWRRYWNTDGSSRPINPRNENECRNQVLDHVARSMEPFGITAALPEGQRANDTRADMLILGHGGANLPVEAKRHYNDELWKAPVEQLEPYTRTPGAAGFGIYLVFWFGPKYATPKRAKGGRPKTLPDLVSMLEADLPAAMCERIKIVGFDVSAPPGTKMALPPQTKTPNAPTATKPAT